MGTAPDVVKRLVDRFDQDHKVFLSGDYKEEPLRAEFLNPLFAALDCDMNDTIDTIQNRNWAPSSHPRLHPIPAVAESSLTLAVLRR
jgi:hypothetical protein